MKKFGILLIALIVGCSSTNLYINDDQSGWDTRKPPESEELLYKVFLIGDAGSPDFRNMEPSLRLLQSRLEQASENSAIVYLGDNLYPHGLPDSTSSRRAKAERKLISQLEITRNFKGRVIMLPGNHDWDKGGAKTLGRQERFVEEYLNRGNTFLPDNGFPGPIEIELMDDDDHPDLRQDIRLVILDTQWWFENGGKPFGDTGDYQLNDAGDFLIELENVLKERRNDHVMVLGHHPLFSNGNHGGYFPLEDHFLPPVFGTLYVAYRKFFGLKQDIAAHRYQLLKNELLYLFEEHEDLIYAAGHEHTLQYFKGEPRKNFLQHYIVSGSGSKNDFISAGGDAEFASGRKGFAEVSFYSDGSSWVEFWGPTQKGRQGKLLFRSQLQKPYADPFDNREVEIERKKIPSYKDSTVTKAANPSYDDASSFFRLLAGDHNRELWSIPVEVPLLDIGAIDGGLTPTEVGGTGQSTTLRLEAEDGQEYVLRSVDKEAGRIWDEELKDTFAHDLAQDQFSIIHPFGAFIIPPLADAVGVYHTNPKLFVVPDDPRLGSYADLMAGEFALFEERPDNDMSHVASMGNSEEVLSTRQMLQEVDADIDHRVDQHAFARARLFDMLIADWDRHPDQWRWGSFEPPDEQGKIYRGIPRDRDLAFFRMNGLVPNIGKLGPFYLYQDFSKSYGNIKGLTKNSLGQTRRFTNKLTKDEWLAIADSMQQQLTNDVIAEAISTWPDPVVEKDGQRTISTLKVRRNKLREVTEEYYSLLADVVDVVGSHKHERFIVEQLDDNRTKVTIEKRTREGEFRKVMYERIFHKDETNEIRIYGLGGVDQFDIQNNINNGIKIRAIGGPGPDHFATNNTTGYSNVHFYDTKKGNTWNVGTGRVHTSDDPDINQYKYLSTVKYDRTLPVLFFGSNSDDGMFIGGGLKFQKDGFRKEPHGQTHTIKANFATEPDAYNVKYNGQFFDVLGDWDFTLDGAVLSPNNIRNFYGLGNETANTESNEEFYQARFSEYRAAVGLQKELVTGIKVGVKPVFEVTNFRQDQNRFITQPQAGISPNTFKDQWTGGVELTLNFNTLDNQLNPKHGIKWKNSGDINIGLKNTTDNYSRLSSSLGIFYSPSLSPQVTIATRFGVQHNIGSFPFYDASTLGSKSNLRGYRSTRFAGRTSAYNNVELRAKLFNVYNYIFGGELGALGFWDTGRVWTDGEQSSVWHYGYGGGLWFSLYESTVISTSVGFSEDGIYYSLGAGFFF